MLLNGTDIYPESGDTIPIEKTKTN